MSSAEEESKISFSEHIHREFKSLADPALPTNTKTAKAQALRPLLQSTDAYITISGPCQAHLPTLDWHGHFRKAYTILMWIRPRLGAAAQDESTIEEDDTADQGPRVLYRLSTQAQDNKAVGVTVTCSDWKVVDDPSSVDPPGPALQTIVTAYALPFASSMQDAGSPARPAKYSSYVQIPLTLADNQWHLLGFSHTYPYLKRPTWSMTLNGALIDQGELNYPVTERPMENCVILCKILRGNALTSPHDPRSDDQKPASELQPSGRRHDRVRRRKWTLDLAAVALYAEAIAPHVQAVVTEAGVQLCLQKGGRIIPTLPPVPNWSKGSSLEGPKVGIPLTVHGSALEIQQLSCRLVFGFTALHARVLGAVGDQQRIVCPLLVHSGTTEQTPRVGLVQPGPPLRVAEDEIPVLYMNGHAKIFHALSNALLEAPANLDASRLDTISPNLSLVWQEGQALSLLVMPFFLALCPPGKLFDRQQKAYTESIHHLYGLFTNEGALGSQLIVLLADAIRHGGARVHEEVLQSGSIHVLASSLRLALLRAQQVKFFTSPVASAIELEQRFLGFGPEDPIDQTRQDSVSPLHVPPAITKACVNLVHACCGWEVSTELPATQIRRSSDLALTAVFGLAFDFDLWGSNVAAAESILKCVASLYGGAKLMMGSILRSQVSAQYFLDSIQLRFARAVSDDTLGIADGLGKTLLSLLMSSLVNKRSISQGEYDVCACVTALTHCALGSIAAHTILNAIGAILVHCEVLPTEVIAFDIDMSMDDNVKMQLSSRLGRNLLVAQFHDVVAPMILSRTALANDRTSGGTMQELSMPYTHWPEHWRLTLLLFSWLASIAGVEGLSAATSSGSLCLASALAGSLDAALDCCNGKALTTLFLPPPGMAMMIGSQVRDEWSYSDLLSDRLQIMMPFVPAMVASIVCRRSLNAHDRRHLDSKSVTALCDVLNAVGGAFHRVLGGIVHTTGGHRSVLKGRNDISAASIRISRMYIPHLFIVIMLLEGVLDDDLHNEDAVVSVSQPQVSPETLRRSDTDSWVDVSSESLIDDKIVEAPLLSDASERELYPYVARCQHSVINTVAGLVSNTMGVGGAGSTTSLFQTILESVRQSEIYAYESSTKGAVDQTLQTDYSDESTSIRRIGIVGKNILCRVCGKVVVKALKRHLQWDMWSYEMSSAVAKMLSFIEDVELLRAPLAEVGGRGGKRFSAEQTELLSALAFILEYGRDTTGWCQLALPVMSPSSEYIRDGHSGDLSSSSKLMLPSLLGSLRLILVSIGHLSGNIQVRTRQAAETVTRESSEPEYLVDVLAVELDATLTAAIVGLSFSRARDVALEALASFRRGHAVSMATNDLRLAHLCVNLVKKTASELLERYRAEGRSRDSAVFDAYGSNGHFVAAESQAVERLLLGGDLFGHQRTSANESVEEIQFESDISTVRSDSGSTSRPREDFVQFHDSAPSHNARLAYGSYDGLKAALAKQLTEKAAVSGMDAIMAGLKPYLDAWDATAAIDAAESEIVEVFDVGWPSNSNFGHGAQSHQSKQAPILGSESAANAMSIFFEFAAIEKTRHSDLSLHFLPSQRYDRIAYTERFAWARFTDLYPDSVDNMWERGVSDGNRDMRSRLTLQPCFPQFRRYIPKYLDHSPDPEDIDQSVGISPRRSFMEGSNGKQVLSESEDIGDFTKTLLQSGKVAILDITKQVEESDVADFDLEAVQAASLGADEELGYEDVPVDEEDGKQLGIGHDISSTSPDTPDNCTETAGRDSLSDMNELGELSSAQLQSEAKSNQTVTASAFGTPPDNASSCLGIMNSAAADFVEVHMEDCLHVKAEGSRSCLLLLTTTHLILEYESDSNGFYDGELFAVQDEADRQRMIAEVGGSHDNAGGAKFQLRLDKMQGTMAATRPKSVRWNLSEVSHVYLRRYRLRDSSLEIFFIPSGGSAYGGYGIFSPSTSIFVDFGAGREGRVRRDDAAFAIMKRSPPQAIKQWPDRNLQFLHDQLSRLTIGWAEGRISNFDYLLHLNMLAGRSYNDICQYPVFPWVLADYTSEEIPNLADPLNFRDLSKPVGALNPERLEDFLERFNTFADPSIPPFMYGSHYSTSAGVVLHFLVRLHPFAGLHRQLQSGHFDVADRLFSSVPRTWGMCTGSSAAEVKELIPEFYCNPAFLRNSNTFKLGTSQDGEILNDVTLPPWASGSPEKFVSVMRAALESDVCSDMLPDWIDLIFGFKQQGPEAIKASNVFFYLTYYGSIDVASIEDEGLRQATELQIAHFGQCPMQLFKRSHVRRVHSDPLKLAFFQRISAYRFTPAEPESDAIQSMASKLLPMPFASAPMSHWVHLDAPPPGPHAPLVSLRLAGVDRCFAVDRKGTFHSFRWAWRTDEPFDETSAHHDFGCFIAQRDLPRFRVVPRLVYAPADGNPAVAISKTLFASRSVLLVLSCADATGGLAMQLVDPAKAQIRGEAILVAAHAAKITCIATDPIGTAAGHGGVGGELAVAGCADGTASLWRFMSSHYLPLRPRVRLCGHNGQEIFAVDVSSTLQVAATVSSSRCCLHSLSNGNVVACIAPPTKMDFAVSETASSKFAATSAMALSIQGFVVVVCDTTLTDERGGKRSVFSLVLYTVEGVCMGIRPLEIWRGVPHKMYCTPDGTAVLVCCGRGVVIHRVAAIDPLGLVDEWHITESDDINSSSLMPQAYDVDLGPSPNRPVVAAAACSAGVLRLHALPGISIWSERHKSGITNSVGSALSKPAQRLNRAFRDGWGLGKQIAGMGRDIGKEVKSDVKERGVTGFLGSVMARKSSGK